MYIEKFVLSAAIIIFDSRDENINVILYDLLAHSKKNIICICVTFYPFTLFQPKGEDFGHIEIRKSLHPTTTSFHLFTNQPQELHSFLLIFFTFFPTSQTQSIWEYNYYDIIL